MSAPAKGAPTPSSANLDLHWGQRIGKFQVLAQLSVGGMAELFLGFTSGPGGFRKYVALKRILPGARDDEQFERMFLDEARITAALNHPNIAQVFELGQDAEGLFLAMEFIAGQNLNQVAGVCRRRGKTLPPGFTLSVARDVCLALHYAHTFTTPGGKPYPVIHRDVAQKNVMVTYDGVVKLLDFGIAKARDGRGQTQVGMVKGTTGYMSPEQVRSEPLDGRSDLFSVGVMLHEMLTGERLFSAQTERQEMEMILEAPIPVPSARVPSLSQAVSTVVLKALARDREQRYPNGREMARAIEAAAGNLLFDAEQRAAFMREHFQDRMEVTRRLLESADEASAQQVDSGMARMLGGGEALESTDPSPERAETHPSSRDESTRLGPRAEAKPRPPPPASRKEREESARPTRGADPDEPVTSPVATTGRRVTREQRVAATGQHGQARPVRKGKGRLVAVILGVLVVGGGAGFGAVKLAAMLEAQEVSEPPVNVAELTAMRPIEPPSGQEKGEPEPLASTPAPEVAARPPAEAPPPVETQEKKDAPAPVKKEGEGEPPVRSVKQGALTLLILPPAEVFLNGRSLGKTPLFNAPVPVGRHLLRIKGADGKRRRLSVPIEAGKTAKFRLALTDIPEG
ncbi:serine/threonine-protein kinase [Archangium sp.]|jgi:serine/threonine-protein kinase|uniref:serine/threonine-protein kinase n=1 Tax=Archangium sp. TaxID=1872627 RepID=UPI002EDA3970